MKHFTKNLTLALLLAAILASAAACGEANSNISESGDTSTAEAEYDRLAELGAKDFGGETFTILDANDKPATHINMHSGEMNGDIVNDALFGRDSFMEERYNVNIEYVQITGGKAGADALKASVLADDDAYDLCISVLMGGSLGTLATEGILANLTEIDALSLGESWWSRLMYDNLQLGGKMYYTTGDISPCMYQMAGAFFLNTGLCEDYGIDTDFCQLVRDGKWTLDAVYSFIQDKNIDVNADGKMHANDDFFGFIHQNYSTTTAKSLLGGAGINLVDATSDGTLVSNVNNEKTLAVLENTARLMTDVQYDNQNDIMSKTFAEDRAIAMMHFTSSASVYLRDMESDYLVLPMPKADEAQETYRSYANPWMDAFIAVAKTADTDFVGFVTEAMAYYSYVNVRPLAYELTYMTKTSRDENSAEMLGIIFDNLYLDFGCITDFGTQSEVLANVLAGKAEFSSRMAAISDPLKSELAAFADAWNNQ
ncbi:MAG: hypothetical protein E7632_05060 [Ruminococcaceae bacterium]|nr:hypothetical protein [Oscillospiraceae bacterium]